MTDKYTDNLSKVFAALRNEGYSDIGKDEAEFGALMNDEGNRKLVYDALTGSGYDDLGDFDSFSSLLVAPQGVTQTAPQSAPKPSYQSQMAGKDFINLDNPYESYVDRSAVQTAPEKPAQAPSDSKEGPMTQEQKDRWNTRMQMNSRVGGMLSSLRGTGIATDEDMMRSDMELADALSRQQARQGADKRTARRAGDDELKSAYKRAASDTEDELKQVLTRLDHNPAYIKKLETETKAVEDKQKDLANLMTNAYQNQVAMYGGSGNMAYTSPQGATNIRNLEAANRLYEDAKNTINAPLGFDGGKKSAKFMKGMGDDMKDPDFWTLGFSNINDKASVRDALKALETAAGSIDGKTAENLEDYTQLSPDQISLIDAYLTAQAANILRSHDIDGMYEAGKGAAESLKFMAEMALTAGIGKAASEGAVKAMTKALGRKLSTMAPKTAVGSAAKWGLKQAGGLGISMAQSAIKAGAMTLTQPLTYESILDKATQVDDKGHLATTWQSIGGGLADQGVETLTEMSGGLPGKALGAGADAIGRVLKTTGKGAAVKAFREGSARVLASKFGTLVRGSKGLVDIGWNNFGEYFEELLGAGIRQIAFGEEGAVDDFFNVKNLGEMTATFAPMALIGLGAGSVNVGKSIHYSNALRAEEQKLRTLVGDTDFSNKAFDRFFNKYQSRLDSRVGGNDRRYMDKDGEMVPMSYSQSFDITADDMAADFASFYDEYVKDNPLTPEQKKQILDSVNGYIKKFQEGQAVNGLLDAQDSASADAELDALTQKLGRDFRYHGKTDFSGNEVVVGNTIDGAQYFITGDLNGEGKYPAVDAQTGEPKFVSAEDLSITQYSQGAYGLELADARKTADEQARIAEQTSGQTDAVMTEFEKQFPVQSTLTPEFMEKLYQATGKTERMGHGGDEKVFVDSMDADGVTLMYEGGSTEQYPWEQIAPIFGATIETKTDADSDMEEAGKLDALADSVDGIYRQLEEARSRGIFSEEDGTQIIGFLKDTISPEDGTVRVQFRDPNGVLKSGRIQYAEVLQKLQENRQEEESIGDLPEDTETEPTMEAPAETPAEPEYQIPRTKDGAIDWDALKEDNPGVYITEYGKKRGEKAALADVTAMRDDYQKKADKSKTTNEREQYLDKVDKINEVLKAYEDRQKAEERAAEDAERQEKIDKITTDPAVFFNTDNHYTYEQLHQYIDMAIDRLGDLSDGATDEQAKTIDTKIAELEEVREAMVSVEEEYPSSQIEGVKVTKKDMEPRTPIELASRLFAEGRIKLKKDSYVKETGHAANSPETKAMWRIFRKDGMSIAAAGETLESEIASGAYSGQPLPEGSEEARNVILELLGQSKNVYDIYNLIRNNRKAESADNKDAQESAVADEIRSRFGVTPEEYEQQLDDVRKGYLLNTLGLSNETVSFQHDASEDVAPAKEASAAPKEEKVEEPAETEEDLPEAEEPTPAVEEPTTETTEETTETETETPAPTTETTAETTGGAPTVEGILEEVEGRENKPEKTSESGGKSVTSESEGAVAAKTSDYGTKNTIVSSDRYAELKRRMKEKLGQLNAGYDPEMLQIGIEMAMFHIEAGARKFVDFAKAMISELSDAIRPYLKSFYKGARDVPGMEEFAADMDSDEEVNKIDVNSINIEDNGNTENDTAVSSGEQVSGDTGDSGSGEDVSTGTDTGTPEPGGEAVGGETDDTGEDSGVEEGGEVPEGEGTIFGGAGEGESEGVSGVGGKKGNGGKRSSSGRSGRTGGKRVRKGNAGEGTVGESTDDSGDSEGGDTARQLTDEELSAIEKTAYEDTKKSLAENSDIAKLKDMAATAKQEIAAADERTKERSTAEGKLKAINARLRELFESANKKTIDITAEKAPYVSVSDPEGKHAIGSVVPSGSADSIYKSLKNVEKLEGKSIAEFVKDELGYKSLDDMFTTANVKDSGLAAEQVDAVGLAISNMKRGKILIIGDQTGLGKGREAAALIRWAVRNKKKVLFVTEQPKLFTNMYFDLRNIGSGELRPLCIGNPSRSTIRDEDEILVQAPSDASKKAMYARDDFEPIITVRKKSTKYDFVMTTYDQVNSGDSGDGKVEVMRKNWIEGYAKDAIVILDESHNAGGDSNRGRYFRDKIVQNAAGATFLSATYAKRPENMFLYAKKSSISELGIPDETLIETISEYGVPMMEYLAESLFAGGEMIRRERDMTGVQTLWPDIKEAYTPEEVKVARDTYDASMDVVDSIIEMQRQAVQPAIDKLNEQFKEDNLAVAKSGSGWVRNYVFTPYRSQVSQIAKLLLYGSKLDRTVKDAIAQIKAGEKPLIVVDNTLDSYIQDIPEEGVENANFSFVLARGLDRSLQYRLRSQLFEKGKPVPEEEGGLDIKPKGSIEAEISPEHIGYVNSARDAVTKYADNDEIEAIPLSPIDYIKEGIAAAGYKVGEITGRSTALLHINGKYVPTTIKLDAKQVVNKYNGGSAAKPIDKSERYDAVVMNRAGSTGESMHASAIFGDQSQRVMDIVQPADNIDTEVQTRGRIDRTGQVKRGKYVYVPSPIPIEQKRTMSLKRKMRKLDANTVGTENVSSNKVNAEDMENKYGDMVAEEYLRDHLTDINPLLDGGGLVLDRSGKWVAREDQMSKLLIALQLLHSEDQETVLKDLEERYIAKIQYLNDNGINDLESTVLKLDAEKINDATFIPGVDNSSPQALLHDAKIERVMVNTLKKHLTSDGVKVEMKRLGSMNSDGTLDDDYSSDISAEVKAKVVKMLEEQKTKYAEKEHELEQYLRNKYPMPPTAVKEEYDKGIEMMPQLADLRAKHTTNIAQKTKELNEGLDEINYATMYLKPGKIYEVPLTDEFSHDARVTYGRFMGYKVGDGKPRSVRAVFAVRDSRAVIDIPIVDQKGITKFIVNTTSNDSDINDLGRWSYNPMLDWDKKWDALSPKNTGRQKRYMLTGNLVVASDKLGKYKGRITTFTRKDSETGEITPERGMLLAEDFDPDAFLVMRPFKLEEIMDSDQEVEDKIHHITAKREGDVMTVKFKKGDYEIMSKHPANRDKKLAELAIGGGKAYASREYILYRFLSDNAAETLKYLETRYGFMATEQFVMPDDPDRVDRLVPDPRPYKDIIDELAPKLGAHSKWSAESLFNNAMKKYRLDAENEENNQKIRDLVTLLQAYRRKEASSYDDNNLAWNAIIALEKMNDPEKEIREENRAKYMAYMDELKARGVEGKEYHLAEGEIKVNDLEKFFNKLNSDKQNAEYAKKIFPIIKKLQMEILLVPNVSREGGHAAGNAVRYNWKFFNSAWISDQMKADTILHEITHTISSYALDAVSNYDSHLLTDNLIEDVENLRKFFNKIRYNDAFKHDVDNGRLQDYGVTNMAEFLAETSSNEDFRKDLDKLNIIVGEKFGTIAFDIADEHSASGKQISARKIAMEMLDSFISHFSYDGHKEFYRGTGFGAARYKGPNDVESILDQAAENERYSYDTKEYTERTDSEEIKRAVDDAASKMGINVRYVDGAPERARTINGRRVEPKGWYNTDNNELTINLARVSNIGDAEAVLMHEAVGHFGLRELFGDKFNGFLDSAYGRASAEIKSAIDRIAADFGYDQRTATEEYLAMLAEEGFDTETERTFFQKVKDAFIRLLHSLGFNMKNVLTDDDFRYLIWESRRNLEASDFLANANKAIVRNRLRTNAEESHQKKSKNRAVNSNNSNNFGTNGNESENNIGSRRVGENNDAESTWNVPRGLVPQSTAARAILLGGANLQPLVSAVAAVRKNSPGGSGRTVSERAVSEALISAAKESGLYIDYIDATYPGVYMKGGAESILRDLGDSVRKLKSPFEVMGLHADNYTNVLDNVIAHNLIFPEAAYKLEGITDDGYEMRLVLTQRKIEGDFTMNPEDRVAFMKELGFTDMTGVGMNFIKNGVRALDVSAFNLLTAKDGKRYCIDNAILLSDPDNDLRKLYDDAIDKQDKNTRYAFAYHGSAADFDHFDSAFIGTGEGAQAYGWGMYVSTNQDTGRNYAEIALGNNGGNDDVPQRAKSQVTIGGHKATTEAETTAATYIVYGKGNIDEAVRTMEGMTSPTNTSKTQERYRAALAILKRIQNGEVEYTYSGPQRQFYTVDIPDDTGENYLHWDQMLTPSQSKRIIDGLKKKYGKELRETYGDELDNELKASLGYGTEGRHVESALNYFLGNERNYATDEDPGAKRNSQFLSSLGFKGMQVDVDRRGGGRWSGSNYVIFDEKDIKIVEHERYSFGNSSTYRKAIQKPSRVSKALRNIQTINEQNDAARHYYEIEVARPSVMMKEQYVDRFIAVSKAMEAIERESGDNAQDYEDFRKIVSTIPSRNRADREIFREKYLEPMNKAVRTLTEVDGVDYDDVVKYAELKHGIERNIELSRKSAMADYVAENQQKVAPLADEIRKHESASSRLLGDRTLDDLTEKELEKYEWHRAEIEKLTEKIDDLNAELEEHRKVLFPKEYYQKVHDEDVRRWKDYENKALRRIDGNDRLTHAEKGTLSDAVRERARKGIEMAGKSLSTTLADIKEHPGKYEALRDKDPRFMHYRGTDGEEGNEGTDYAAIRSWFSEYVFPDGAKMIETPTRNAFETKAEYNARLASLRKVPDNAKNITDAEKLAQQWIDNFEVKAGDAKVKGLWNAVNAATNGILDHQLKHHTISLDQHATLKERFKYYVPLRGFAEDTAEDLWNYGHEDHSGDFAAPLLPMQGRTSKPAAPFAYIGTMADSAILQDNENELRRSLYKFVARRKENSLITIADSWYEKTTDSDDDEKSVWVPAYPNITVGAPLEEQKRIRDEFEERMKNLQAAGLAVYGSKGVNLNGAVIHIDNKDRDKHLVRVMNLGKEYFMIVNGNPRAALAINGLLNVESSNENKVLDAVRAVTRTMSMLNTGASPGFWFANYAKDFVTGFINTAINEDASYLKDFQLHRAQITFTLIPTIMREGKFVDNPNWDDKQRARAKHYADLYRLYVENGGPTGYAYISNTEFYEKELKRLVDKDKKLARTAKEVWDGFMKVGKLGEALEQIPRFAAFMTSYESKHRSLQQSILDAKDVTLNFNVKGAASGISWDYTRQMQAVKKNGNLRDLTGVERVAYYALANISPVARSIYMFFNPAVQGVDKLMRNFKASGVKTGSAIAIMLAAGYVRAMLGGMFGGGDGDDDKYNTILAYRRQNNFIIPLGPIDVLWPISQEYAPFYAVGDMLAQLSLKRVGPKDKPVYEMMDAVTSLLPLNPLEPIDFVPDALTPIVEVMRNRNFMGSYIYYDYENNKNKPGYTKAPASTWKALVDFSQWANSISGGDYATKGWANTNPAIAQHLIEGIGGGLLRDLGNLSQEVESAFTPQEWQFRNTMVLRRFIYNPDEYQSSYMYDMWSQFYGEVKEANRLKSAYKGDVVRSVELEKSKRWKYRELYNDSYKDILEDFDKEMDAAPTQRERNEINKLRQKVRAQFAEECLDIFYNPE